MYNLNGEDVRSTEDREA